VTAPAQVLIAWATEPFNPSPTWTDVSAYVRFEASLSMNRGRQDNISAIQAGTLTLTVDNSDGRFTAGLSTSPYAPNVKIGRRIQVNVADQVGTLHTRFDGLITELPAVWEDPGGHVNLAVIQASDILAWLSRQPELLSWTQQEMLADGPLALYSLADTSGVTSAADQAGQGAAPLQVVSQGDGTGAAAAGSGVPLTEIQTSNIVAQLQTVQVTTFPNPGSVSWTAPLGTIVSCKAECWAAGTAGTTGAGSSSGGPGGKGGEYAAEPLLAVTPGLTYTGTVGTPGAPSAGAGGDTTFTGDSVTVAAHGTGSGSTNTIHFSSGAGAVNSVGHGGGGGSSGGPYQAGNAGLSTAGTGGAAVASGGAGGSGDAAGSGAGAGAAPGGGGGGGFGSPATAGGSGGAGQIIITCTYIPVAASQQNSAVSSWLFTPSATLAARVLSGPLPQPVTAAAGFALECWAAFAGIPVASVTTVTTPGSMTFTGPPGCITADVACWAAGQAGTSPAGAGGTGGEYAEEAALAITPDSVYSGSVGAAGAPSGGLGGNTSFTGDSVTVLANGSGSGSANTVHHPGGSGGALSVSAGGGGGSAGGPYQAGNPGLAGNVGSAAGGVAVTGGGAGGAGDTAGAGAGPGAAPGGGGGGGHTSPNSSGASGAPGQMVITCQPGVSTLLTLVNPRGQNAIAVWVTSAGHLQLASTSGYGTRSPSWTAVDAGQVPAAAFHVVVSVAVTTGIAALYVNNVNRGTLTLPAGASYAQVTAGGAYGAWLGGWNGSAGLAAVYPAALSSARIGVHYAAGTTGFAGSSTGTMISKIAAYAGLPSFWYTAPSGVTDPSYGLELVSYYDIHGQQPLAAMQQYEIAEGGVLSVNAAGALVFADRASRYAAAAAGSAFTLAAGQYKPDTSFKSNDQFLTTAASYATVHLPGGYPVSNAPAKLDFGQYAQNAGTLTSPQTAPFTDSAAALWQVRWTGDGVTATPGAQSQQIPGITAGNIYSASALFWSPQGWSNGQLNILWFTSGGAFISTGAGIAAAVPAGTVTLLTTGPLTAPALAARYTVVPQMTGTPASSVVMNAAWNRAGAPGELTAASAPGAWTWAPNNSATVTNPGTAPAPWNPAAAPVTFSADDLMDAGNWAVGIFGQPVTRVPSATIDILTLPAAEFSVASFYAADIGSAVQLAGLPSQAPDAAGQPLSAYQVIEGINETLTIDQHDVQLYTSPLAQNAAWIPGDALLGVLGTTNTIGRSQSPAAPGAPYTPVPAFGATLNRTGSVGAQDMRTLTVNVQNRLTPPLLIAQQAAAQTITTLAGQAVTFDTILADTSGGLTTVATYTVPAGFAGYYWCAATVQAATGNGSLGGIAAWFAAVLAGVASQWHARVIPYLSGAPYTSVAIAGRIGPCAAGDTIQVIAAAAGSPASMPLGTADGGSMLTLIWQGN
jgi:hypothetical protein